MQAVEGGKVPVGSSFIVESFDRLSRATPRQALSIFARLLYAGLNVVTLTDPPKRFSAASVDANTFELDEDEQATRVGQLVGTFCQRDLKKSAGTA